MRQYWIDLARRSVIDPRGTAAEVAGLQISGQTLTLLVVLVAVLNGIFYGLFLPVGLLPGIFSQPVPMAILFGVVFVIGALALTWVGRAFGGEASPEDMLKVSVWLQLIRLVAQVVLLLVGFAVPLLSALLGAAAGIWGIYMMVCFVAAAHRIDSLLKSLGVVGFTFFGAVLILSVLLSVLGVQPTEV